MTIPTLTTEHLILRPPQASDFDAWAAFFLTPRAVFVGGGAQHDISRAWRGFASIIGHWTMRDYGLFVVEERASGAPLGAVGPWYPAGWPEREIGWSLWPDDVEGKGYGHEACRAVLNHVFNDLGWTTAVSYIDPANARSIALARRLGATLDTTANVPVSDIPPLVYRHPAPEAAT